MYVANTPLPEWIEPVKGLPGHYMIDPELFYPVILKFMETTPKMATRYDMETALGVAKKLTQWHSRRCKHGWCGQLLILSRKPKWVINTYPVGDKPDISSPLATGARNAAVREVWNRLMG